MVDKVVRLPSSLTEIQDKRPVTEVRGDESGPVGRCNIMA